MAAVTEDLKAVIDKRYLATLMVFLSQIILMLILVLAAVFRIPGPESRLNDTNAAAVWVLIIFIAAGCFILRRVLFRWARLKDIKLLRGTSGLLAALQTNTVILGAIAELVAVAGFAVWMMSGEMFDSLRAAAVASILFAINFPRKSLWLKIVDSLGEV